MCINDLKKNLQLHRDSIISLGFKERKTKNQIITVINRAICDGTKNNVDSRMIKFLFKARYLYLTKKDKKIENSITRFHNKKGK